MSYYRRDRGSNGRDRDRDRNGRDNNRSSNRQQGNYEPQREPTGYPGMEWRRIDLHLHTPASSDYRDPDASYLKILLKAEERGLDIIALTDHNTVSGYAQMLKEIETLELLERLGRIAADEAATLAEYRRLRETLLVLPGFEFTATFGFHILGIFPPGTSMRKIEMLLLSLKVPEDKMLAGAPNAGATSDVLDAYEAINEAGGLAIPAHVNSSNGVAMQGFNFGGQTKIAYTQDPSIVALEVTDLDQTGRRTTASFFNGSKPEYPRRMHCIQGSDAHSIEREPGDGTNKRLGVGDRCTEVLLPEVTFEALRKLFTSSDFDRVRPYRPVTVEAYDFVRAARDAGPSIIQAFHERAISKTSKTRPIIRDIAAFANTSGGTVFVGVSPEASAPIRGVERPEEVIAMLRLDTQHGITPPLDVDFHVQSSEGRPVVMIQVPQGSDRPYMYDPAGQIYIRQEGDSVVASRDDIVRLVLEARLAPSAAEVTAEVEALEQAEEATEELVEDVAAAPATASDSAARRRRRRRRSGGERNAESIADLIGIELPTEEEDVPPAVPAWDTTPAFEGPEDDYVFDQHGHAHVTDEEKAQMALAAGDTDALVSPEAEELPADQYVAAVEQAIDETIAAETATSAEPDPELMKRKGLIYQVYNSSVNEPKLGNAQFERRAGLYADRAGELLNADLRAANPEGMFELERNQMWLPEGVAPQMPEGLNATSRSKAPLTAYRLNAKSGPGGTFRGYVELMPTPPPPAPEPEPEPEPVALEPVAEAAPAKPSRSRRRKKGEAEAAPVAEAAPAETPAPVADAPASEPEAETSPAPAEPAPKTVGGRVLPQEKLSGRKARQPQPQPQPEAAPAPAAPAVTATPVVSSGTPAIAPPKTGVEVVETEMRNAVAYHTMRDLRNNSKVHNVTRYSARRLWYYAIMRHEAGPPELSEITWAGDVGLWRKVYRAGTTRYDLVSRDPDGTLHVYYGVTDEGIDGPWRALDLSASPVEQDDEGGDWS